MSPKPNRKTRQNSGYPIACPELAEGFRLWGMVVRSAATLAVALLLSLAASTPLHAQGCTQCRDNLAATPPRTQTAYRRAIILMAVAASGIFLGTLVLLKHQP
jgi:hypothetical protein